VVAAAAELISKKAFTAKTFPKTRINQIPHPDLGSIPRFDTSVDQKEWVASFLNFSGESLFWGET
jgi:hypothetical protein